jgi:hypothetical protein
MSAKVYLKLYLPFGRSRVGGPCFFPVRGAVDVTTHEPEKVQDANVVSRAHADLHPSMVALTRTGYGN